MARHKRLLVLFCIALGSLSVSCGSPAREYVDKGLRQLGSRSGDPESILDQALADFSKAIELDPECQEAYRWRIHLYYLSGDYDSAVCDADRLIELDPENPTHYVSRARLRGSQGNWDRAIADYTTALALKPRDAEALLGLASALRIKGLRDEAIEVYTQVLAINGAAYVTYFQRAQLWYDSGDYRKAIKDLQEARRLVSANALFFEGHVLLAKAWTKLGEKQKADEHFQRAIDGLTRQIALVPRQPSWYRMRGKVWFDMGRYEAAVADFGEAIQLSPSYVVAWIDRGCAWDALGQQAKAEADWEVGVKLIPERFQGAWSYARLLEKYAEERVAQRIHGLADEKGLIGEIKRLRPGLVESIQRGSLPPESHRDRQAQE